MIFIDTDRAPGSAQHRRPCWQRPVRGPEHMVRMTWYVVDRADYLARGRDIGAAYREVMGHYDVAMSAVAVSALMEARAKVEIEVTAVVPQAL